MTVGELLRRAWYLLHRDRATRELEEEMRLHVQFRAESLVKRKQTSVENPLGAARESAGADERASADAQRRFGNTTAIQERSRDMWGLGGLEALSNDFRFAVRRLLRRRGFAFGVVSVMAIGIGAVTAMFSAVDAALLKPLPFKSPEQLMVLALRVPFHSEVTSAGEPERMLDMTDARKLTELFSDVAAYASGGLNLADAERPQRLKVGAVTSNFFSTLSVQPASGRVFSSAEGVPGGADVTVLSYGLWQRQYGGRDIIGQRISLGTRSYEVIGVMPRGFTFPEGRDLWVPMSVPTTAATFAMFRGYNPSVTVARLVPGVTPSVATAQLLARAEQWYGELDSRNKENQKSFVTSLRTRGIAFPLRQQLVGDRKSALLVLLGATGLLLLIACVNVTNLLLSQATARRRELAVRQALGATRARIVRQLLTECVVLSVSGAVLGILLAPLALQLMRALMPESLAGIAPADVNGRVLLFATMVAIATGIAFGLWPAFRSTRGQENDVIKSGGGHGATAGGAGRVRRMLVVAELALTVMLLVGAGLMLRSFSELMQLESGLRPSQVGTLELTMPPVAGNRAERVRKLNEMVERLAEIPGMQSAGAINDLPLNGVAGVLVMVTAEGVQFPKGAKQQWARFLFATRDYFSTVGVTLLRGRLFTAADDSAAAPAVVVSKRMAEEYWPNIDPVGRTLKLGDDQMTVVGVVSDVREFRLEDEAGPQMYLHLLAGSPVTVAVVARGTMPRKVLLSHMTAAVRSVDKSQAVYNVRMMEDVVSNSVAPRRTNTLLIGTFAALALVLASVGVYAVVSYGVSHRRRELGIRSALGATGADLVTMISSEMVWVTALGLVIGLAGAWALSKTLASLVYGVSVHDPVSFLMVPLALLIPTVLATLIPARRALRVNPAEVMRAD